MNRVVSFSLWGSLPMYLVGATENAKLVKKFYPGWTMVCWCGEDVPPAVTKQLRALGVDVREPDKDIAHEMFWRLLIADDPTVERFLIRDLDSRITHREVNAVNSWIESGKDFHMMSDHPHHQHQIMGGLWGAKTRVIPNMRKLIIDSKMASVPYVDRFSGQYDADMRFLSQHVWPIAKKSFLMHNSCTRSLYPESVPFPDGSKFSDHRFCGEIILADGTPEPHGWQQRINFQHP